MKIAKKKRSPTFQPLTIDRQTALRDLPLASFRARLGAYAIDMFLVCLICGVIEVLLRLPEIRHPHGNVHIEINPFHSWSLVVLALYYGLTTYWGHGQTLGKRLMRIRVVSLPHDHLSLWHSFERALGYAASAAELGFGFLQYFIHPNRQTVHDRIADTIVVKVPKGGLLNHRDAPRGVSTEKDIGAPPM
ncbi:MAG TPA: RDD family protein [Thermoanaerobaculia bacterium]|jgi:uncharacterized RDD family membrane protein YckC|nr:RDD family protein [Thermoanaerobaculia bacterium]